MFAHLRYLEKVLPGPYGPQLPWWFPGSPEFWRTGDVEAPDVAPCPALRRWAARAAAAALPWQRRAAAYERARPDPLFAIPSFILPMAVPRQNLGSSG